MTDLKYRYNNGLFIVSGHHDHSDNNNCSKIVIRTGNLSRKHNLIDVRIENLKLQYKNYKNVVYASTNLASIKKHEAAVHDKKKSFQCRHCPHSAFARDKIVIRIKLLNVINVNTPHPAVITSKNI